MVTNQNLNDKLDEVLKNQDIIMQDIEKVTELFLKFNDDFTAIKLKLEEINNKTIKPKLTEQEVYRW